ncbi:MAG: ABC transporter ATP-binding protein [Alphaproteobacteria bacterium]|nr:ABC transporter ATP-binding protein [Alphaproteobacteria bacterium]
MIEVQNLTKTFADFTAVSDLSFRVSKGDVLGFLGPNGAGKSTTMKMLVGFLRPSGGQIMVDGIDMVQDPLEGQKRLGYLPEGAPAWVEMTPREFLHFITAVRGLDKAAAHKALARAIDLTQLHNVLDQPIDTLSKGYRRRVGLAQAILHDPDILIMDEPTDGLDPNQKSHIRAAIKEMATDTAIIVSTHILEEVDAICTRAMIIDRGRHLASGTPAELAARSRYCGAVEVVVKASARAAVATLLKAQFSDIECSDIEFPATKMTASHGDNNNDTRFCVFAANKSGDESSPKIKAADFLRLVQDCLAPQQEALLALSLQSGRLDDVFATLTAAPNTATEKTVS